MDLIQKLKAENSHLSEQNQVFFKRKLIEIEI